MCQIWKRGIGYKQQTDYNQQEIVWGQQYLQQLAKAIQKRLLVKHYGMLDPSISPGYFKVGLE